MSALCYVDGALGHLLIGAAGRGVHVLHINGLHTTGYFMLAYKGSG